MAAKIQKSAEQSPREFQRKFTLAQLRENCRKLFGVSISTFDGATYGLTDKYTIEEIRTRIETWSSKGVK